MNRVKKSSWWSAVLVGGLLLALPAAAQGKGKGKGNDPEACRVECSAKANSAAESCALACPKQDANNGEAAGKCMARCSEKFRAASESCDKTCPAIKKPEQLH